MNNSKLNYQLLSHSDKNLGKLNTNIKYYNNEGVLMAWKDLTQPEKDKIKEQEQLNEKFKQKIYNDNKKIHALEQIIDKVPIKNEKLGATYFESDKHQIVSNEAINQFSNAVISLIIEGNVKIDNSSTGTEIIETRTNKPLQAQELPSAAIIRRPNNRTLVLPIPEKAQKAHQEKFNQKMRLLLQNLNIFNVSDNDIGNLLLQSLKNPIKNINEVPVKGRLSLNLDSSSNLNETLVFNGIFNTQIHSMSLKSISKGAFGKTYQVENFTSNNPDLNIFMRDNVVIKILNNKMRNGSTLTRKSFYTEQFIINTQIAGFLQEYIAKFFQYGLIGHCSKLEEMTLEKITDINNKKKCNEPIDDGCFMYILMEKGSIDLLNYLPKITYSPKKNSLIKITMVKQLLFGMNKIHELGITHRDIKPDNILCFLYNKDNDLITKRNQTDEPVKYVFKYIDFGLMHSISKYLCSSTEFTISGTSKYQPPDILIHQLMMNTIKNTTSKDLLNLYIEFGNINKIVPNKLSGAKNYKVLDYWALGITFLQIISPGLFNEYIKILTEFTQLTEELKLSLNNDNETNVIEIRKRIINHRILLLSNIIKNKSSKSPTNLIEFLKQQADIPPLFIGTYDKEISLLNANIPGFQDIFENKLLAIDPNKREIIPQEFNTFEEKESRGILQQVLKLPPLKCVVFDFDECLMEEHIYRKYKDKKDEIENTGVVLTKMDYIKEIKPDLSHFGLKEDILPLFQLLKAKNIKIVIASFGVRELIEHYLNFLSKESLKKKD